MASGNSTGEYICRMRAYHQLTHLTIRGIEPSNLAVSYKLKKLARDLFANDRLSIILERTNYWRGQWFRIRPTK